MTWSEFSGQKANGGRGKGRNVHCSRYGGEMTECSGGREVLGESTRGRGGCVVREWGRGCEGVGINGREIKGVKM